MNTLVLPFPMAEELLSVWSWRLLDQFLFRTSSQDSRAVSLHLAGSSLEEHPCRDKCVLWIQALLRPGSDSKYERDWGRPSISCEFFDFFGFPGTLFLLAIDLSHLNTGVRRMMKVVSLFDLLITGAWATFTWRFQLAITSLMFWAFYNLFGKWDRQN